MTECLKRYLHGEGSLAAVRTAQDFDEFCAAVAADTAGRIRWRTERTLALPPWRGTPGRDDYLYALAQLRLDRVQAMERLCPACRTLAGAERCRACGAPLPIQNPAFDEGRYEELKQYGATSAGA